VTRLRLAVGLLVALVLGGACSAPVDSGPKTIRSASLPVGLRSETPSTTTTTSPSGESVEVTVYLIGPDQRLQPVKRQVTTPVTVEKVLQKLFAGPTTAEQANGLRTAISQDTTILGSDVEASIVTVDTSKNFAFGNLPDQISAFGQVVFSAVDVGGVNGVLFAQNGRKLAVPQGDGTSTSLPLGKAAYAQVSPR
jgi:spore germination protein GerM